jgi:sugar phosphate isomerase/epimerase
LGADVVVVHLPVRWPLSILVTAHRQRTIPLLWRRNHADITWFQQGLPFLQASTEVAIAVEIMPQQRLFGWPINACEWNTLEEWSTRFEHLTLDTTHCGTWRVDPLKAYTRAQDRVRHVHLSNFDGREHRLPHQGKLQLDRFLHRLATDGYAGDVAVETGPDAMESDDEDRVRANLVASLDFCRQHLQARG